VKSALRWILIAFLMSMLVVIPDVSQVVVSSGNTGKNADSWEMSTTAYPPDRVFLSQTFDIETIGKIPDGWYIANSQYGNITLANDGYGSTRKSAMIIDNSSVGYPGPYRYFEKQTKTIGISFALRPTNNSDSKTIVEIFVDDGNFNGASIIFKDGKIGYRQKYGDIFPLPYVPDRWYTIKLILNVPRNVYSVYINDHLEAVNASFLGACTQLNRIVFNETSGKDGLFLPVAYVDEILGRQVIEIPRDYSTIQEGVNAANPYDVVFVTGQRTYYESVIITRSIELVGEDEATTVIDGSHAKPGSPSDGILIQANNVFVHEFTVRSTSYGAGIRVCGSNNIVEDNVVTNGLGDGFNVTGSGNCLARNVIKTNMKYGVQISGANCTLVDNTIIENDACGVKVSGSNCNVSDNFIGSNFACGIWIAKGDNGLVRNNTIRKNALGVKCDAATADNRIFQNRFIGNDQEPQALDDGFNIWDDGYPYLPGNKTGGGNYWSDFESVDIYFGPDQDRRSCFLAPDGISDAPYHLSSKIKDRYPLFITQGVTDNTIPKDKSVPCTQQYVDYDTGVLVTAYFLRNVTVNSATIFVEYQLASDVGHESVAMGISDPSNNTWKGTIPGKKYGTVVTYNVSVHAELDSEVKSTNYPLSAPFSVGDHLPPTIGSGGWAPYVPDENQTILVWAVVTEPSNASGVASVSLSYLFGNTWWTADMIRTIDDNYTALMPKQPGNTKMSCNITAVDRARNNVSTPVGINVVVISTLNVSNTVTSMEPCDIDLGVMYRGETRTDSRLTLFNIGQENLAWNIVTVNSGDWLKSISSPNGVLQPGKSTTVAFRIDTTSCLDPNLYVTELTVIANGSVPRWVVLLRFVVRDIVIDASWCSVPAPLRSNINTNVTFAFHAKWTHNCTDATSGNISVGGFGSALTVNSTGWITYDFNLSSANSKTFWVLAVDFTYTKDSQTYHIRSFTQKAENLTAIWDRVKLVLKLADDRIDVNSQAVIAWDSSVYEYDNSKFMGSVDLNDTLPKATVGRYCITASSINDTKYDLTAFQSNSVFCVWDRFKINVGGVSNTQTQVGKAETIWFMALYEYDNIVFKGANGTLYVDVYVLMFNETAQRWIWVWNRTDPMDFSSLDDTWKKSYSFDDSGPRIFVVSQTHSIEDRLYNLTAYNDLVVPPLGITWYGGWSWWPDPHPPFIIGNSSSPQSPPIQGSLELPLWAFAAIVATLAIGLFLIFAMIIASGRKRNHKIINGKMKDNYQK